MKFGKKQLVLASLVLALGAAVYLNWQFAGTGRLPVGDSSSETSQLGAAQLVNNTYVETVNDGAESGEATGDALAQARMDRQNSRDQALELLDGVLEDVDSDSAAKQQAVEEASAIAQNILAESNVESLLEAKGYTDCVAYITAQECSVVLAGAVVALWVYQRPGSPSYKLVWRCLLLALPVSGMILFLSLIHI